MGMFDYVKYEDKCECGADLNEFQSKDAECLMEELESKAVRSFYNICDACGKYHSYTVVVEVIKDKI